MTHTEGGGAVTGWFCFSADFLGRSEIIEFVLGKSLFSDHGKKRVSLPGPNYAE